MNINLNNQNKDFNIEQNAPAKKLNIRIIQQETSSYCAAACTQMIFQYYGFHLPQSFIFDGLGGTISNGVTWNENSINWINNRLEDENVNTRYYRTSIPQGFGQTNQERLMFQNYVLSSLNQNVPIIFSFRSTLRGEVSENRHSVIIYGIEINDQDSGQTVYYIGDPDIPQEHATRISIRGIQLNERFLSAEEGYFIGPNTNFDFQNRQITVKTPNQSFAGNLQNQTIERNQAVDLTKEAGIASLSQLKQFKTVTLSDFNVKTTWFDKSKQYKIESWQTKWFINGQSAFKKYDHYSWIDKYRSIAQGEFETRYSSGTWFEDDGSFYLNLTYQFFAQTLLTTTLIYAQIFLGSKWVLTF